MFKFYEHGSDYSSFSWLISRIDYHLQDTWFSLFIQTRTNDLTGTDMCLERLRGAELRFRSSVSWRRSCEEWVLALILRVSE